MLGERVAQVLVQRCDAVVVEGRGARAEDRHVVRLGAEGLAVAHELAAHVAHRVGGAAALVLVDRDGVGEVEHVDLLELAGRAELRRHDVHRVVDEGDDRRVALADAGGLDEDEVVAGGLGDVDDRAEVLGDLVRPAGGQAAEEDGAGTVVADRVHPDAVAEQGAAALAARGVDGDDRDPQLVLLVDAEAAHELVGERGLARAAGAGEPEDRGGVLGGRLADAGEEGLVEASPFGPGDRPGDGRPVAGEDGVDVGRPLLPQVDVARLDEGVDHAGQAEALAVLGGEDAHARVAQPLDLGGDDDAAAAAEDLDVPGTALAEQLDEVLEVLDVPALVGADRHALDVLVDRRLDHLGDGAVVPEVDDLGPLALEDAPHDVDRRVVTVEEGGRGDEAHRVGGRVQRHD